MVIEMYCEKDDGEIEVVYEEETPGSAHATKLLGIITKVWFIDR